MEFAVSELMAFGAAEDAIGENKAISVGFPREEPAVDRSLNFVLDCPLGLP